ncbi:MAG: hypothetical protein H7Z39_03955 [Burkholderiaceae bacterium]|nr:hypothetical protein [Burkholderiaceae bacterium]
MACWFLPVLGTAGWIALRYASWEDGAQLLFSRISAEAVTRTEIAARAGYGRRATCCKSTSWPPSSATIPYR